MMNHKIRLRKKYVFKMKKSSLFLLSLGFLFFFVFWIFQYASKVITPKLETYAESELQKFNSLIINKMIVKEINDTISMEDLFIISKDEENSIHTIDFNPIAVNRLLSIVTNSLQTDFKNLEQGNYEVLELEDTILSSYDKDLLKRGIVFTIPSGMISNNPFFSNLGPKIPVRFSLIGNITSKINTKVTNYGINNALLEVNIDVTITERMILPFLTKNISTTVSVPMVIKMVQGTVPNYYFGGIDKNSNIVSLPIE